MLDSAAVAVRLRRANCPWQGINRRRSEVAEREQGAAGGGKDGQGRELGGGQGSEDMRRIKKCEKGSNTKDAYIVGMEKRA